MTLLEDATELLDVHDGVEAIFERVLPDAEVVRPVTGSSPFVGLRAVSLWSPGEGWEPRSSRPRV
jgi:hypothetical protein